MDWRLTMKTPEELYAEREKRVLDAIALKKPDRVPVWAFFGEFSAQYAGITHKEEQYDLEKHTEADWKSCIDFEPDLASRSLFIGPTHEALGYTQLKWAGYGLPDNGAFQFIEGEYMKAEEYDRFLYDPTDFVVRSYWPRIYGSLKGFETLPRLSNILSYFLGGVTGFMFFGTPQGKDALAALSKAGDETLRSFQALGGYVQRLKDKGFPMAFASTTQTPFDTLGDFFRGTRELMLDMYRRPEKVVKACEKLLPMMLEAAIGPAKRSGNPRVFIPLHKGQEGFMNLEQFKKFYWPTFRGLLIGLVNEGLTPVVLLEGTYTSRLDIIRDVPEGKMIYWFEDVDIVKAKEALGGKVCIMGSVPMSLLVGGTPDQIRGCCKNLIDIAGKDGAYIMCPAAADCEDVKTDNLKAMFEFTKEYGVY
jgi:uroporphyrinogen-III decarboxylase